MRTSQKWVMFLTVALAVGAAGVGLNWYQARMRLGEPGLKMVAENVLDTEGHVVNTNTVALPARILDHDSTNGAITLDEIGWLPKDTTFARRIYAISGTPMPVELSVILMGTDRTSIHKPQMCLDGQGWRIDSSEVVNIPIASPYSYDLPVMKLTSTKVMNGSPYRSLYVYWFVSNNHLTALHGERMWWTATELFKTGVVQRWAYVSFFSVCRPGEEEATFSKIKAMIAASVPEFQRTTGPAVALETGERSGIEETSSLRKTVSQR